MTITEFHAKAAAAIAAEPNQDLLIELAKEAQELADMVSWAEGVIDKEGRVSEAFSWLQKQAVKQHEATGDKNVAILHDAVSDLLAAIYRHDEDFDPSSNAGDNAVDI